MMILPCISAAVLVLASRVHGAEVDMRKEFAVRYNKAALSLSGDYLGALGQIQKAQGTVHRTDQMIVKWVPMKCSLLNLDLKKREEIKAGSRNILEIMEDRIGGKTFIRKTFKEAKEYTAELFIASVMGKHEYFAEAICYSQSSKEAMPFIIYEHVKGPNSGDYANLPGTELKDIKRISAQLLKAMEDLHYHGFIHADLKPANVMIDEHGNVKVIDLGLGAYYQHITKRRGTRSTMAPELLDLVAGPVTEAIDFWAYGSTVADWLTRHLTGQRYCFCHLDKDGDTPDEMMKLRSIPKEFDVDARAFLMLFLQPFPAQRTFMTNEELDFIKRTPFLLNALV